MYRKFPLFLCISQPKVEGCPEEVDGPKALEKKGSSSDEDEDEEEDSVPVNHVINKRTFC